MRQSFAGSATDFLGIYRHFAEVQHLHAFGLGNFLDLCVKRRSFERIFDKEHRNTVAFRKCRVQLAEELVRHRKQKAGAITRFRVATSRTAMHEPFQDRNTLQHNLVRGDIINIGDQADTTGVMFVGRIVKCLSVHIYPFLVFCAPFMQKSCQTCKTSRQLLKIWSKM